MKQSLFLVKYMSRKRQLAVPFRLVRGRIVRGLPILPLDTTAIGVGKR